jgi:rRNA-processing protein FCF1
MAFILCDTDFLIKATTEPLPELAKFLQDSGYQITTLDKIQAELKGLLLSKNSSTARKAKAALRSIESGSVKVLKYDNSTSKKADADALLIDFAQRSKEKVVVATLDHTILSFLEKKRLPYLTLRNDKPLLKAF